MFADKFEQIEAIHVFSIFLLFVPVFMSSNIIWLCYIPGVNANFCIEHFAIAARVSYGNMCVPCTCFHFFFHSIHSGDQTIPFYSGVRCLHIYSECDVHACTRFSPEDKPEIPTMTEKRFELTFRTCTITFSVYMENEKHQRCSTFCVVYLATHLRFVYFNGMVKIKYD